MRPPRPRGDRPGVRDYDAKADAPPPPTRGSALAVALDPVPPGAPPAHAGIGPSIPCAGASRAPPPPTRGSARCDTAHLVQQIAPPAHAGIGRKRLRRSCAPRRPPRPRGDRPGERPMSRPATRPPPPTRGSARVPLVLRVPLVAPPAHAGIGRPTGAGRAPCRGPPAHAGIGPSHRRRWRCARGPPRPRGDRPLISLRHRWSYSAWKRRPGDCLAALHSLRRSRRILSTVVRPPGWLGPRLAAIPASNPAPSALPTQGPFPPTALFGTAIDGTTIPSDSRCAPDDFALGLYVQLHPDEGGADGSLAFRTSPCPRAAPPTPPTRTAPSVCSASRVAFTVT
jgi:hypothetical protein